MGFIKLNFNKNFKYIVIYWILEIALNLTRNLKREYFILIKEDNVQNEYMSVIISNISDLLSGFLYLYIRIASKSPKKKEEKKEKEEENDLIYEEMSPAPRNNNLIIVMKGIIISILEYLSRSFYWISYAIISVKSKEISHLLQKDLLISTDIFVRYIFSIFVLKSVIYKHGKFSLILMGIGFIILLTADFLLIFCATSNLNINKTLSFTGILLFRSVIIPYEHTLIKQLFLNNYIIPELMQFIRGLFELVIILIITPILYYSFKLDSKFNFDKLTVIFMIINILVGFIKAYILLKVIYNYSIQSVSFLLISQSLPYSIYGIIYVFKYVEEKNADDFILISFEILGILIILFATLVYDEIIIINKWNLNKNVKLFIMKRGEDENEDMDNLDDMYLMPTIKNNLNDS